MTERPFKGVLPALVTPFRDGRLDLSTFAALVERQIAAGVDGLVPVGTTGEASTLSHDEYQQVIGTCVETAAGRVPVLAGCGGNDTARVIELVKDAHSLGADGALIVTPWYNRPSQEGLFRHYQAVALSALIPIVLYNVPGRTGVDLSNETVIRLAAVSRIVGIKDATGDLARASLMRIAAPAPFTLLSGDDPTFLGYMAHGGQGVISVTANVAPEAMVALYRAAASGDFRSALQWQDRLISLHKALFLDASPAPTKSALARLGLCTDEVRLPLTTCSPAVRPALHEAMRLAGLT